ncbi:hypothetical protein AAHE18_19G036300 [Arachis hypogaea]
MLLSIINQQQLKGTSLFFPPHHVQHNVGKRKNCNKGMPSKITSTWVCMYAHQTRHFISVQLSCMPISTYLRLFLGENGAARFELKPQTNKKFLGKKLNYRQRSSNPETCRRLA